MEWNRGISRRRALALVSSAALAGLVPACGWDGHFTVLGYTTRPNYHCNIHTVRAPIFQNRTHRFGFTTRVPLESRDGRVERRPADRPGHRHTPATIPREAARANDPHVAGQFCPRARPIADFVHATECQSHGDADR